MSLSVEEVALHTIEDRKVALHITEGLKTQSCISLSVEVAALQIVEERRM